MAAPASILAYGSGTLLTAGPKERRLFNGLDRVEASYHAETARLFNEGQAFPGYTNVIIDEVEQDPDGEDFEYRITGRGICAPKATRLVSSKPQENLEDFDTCTQVWVSANKRSIVAGSRMQGYGNMVCMTATPEEMDLTGFYTITAQFKGLLGSYKPVKRTVSSNVEIISLDSAIVTLSGGWNEAHKSQICWPKVTCTFEYWTSYIPIKTMPQQGGSPADNLPSVSYISGSGVDLTYHWPNGWRMIAFNPAAIAGTQICYTSETWEWQQKQTF